MIQRIQSVFLLLIAIAMFAMFFLPIWGKFDGEKSLMLDAMGMIYREGGVEKASHGNIYVAGLAGLVAAIAIGSLLSYKDRKKQVMLNLLNAFLMLCLVGLVSYLSMIKGNEVLPTGDQAGYGIGFYMPIAGLILNSIANRFINKDEKMVKSIDRLR